jgi:hypothetical protein
MRPRTSFTAHRRITAVKLLVIGGVIGLILLDVGAAQTRLTDARRAETYQSVSIDAHGSLVITTSDQRTIVVPKEGEQSSFSEPVLSSARTAVGAQAQFPNCCTSYDIPLQLVIYANGKVHRFTGIGLPIFQWHFADGGSRVAFGQEPVHFGCSIHYELRDVQSERLIDSADIPEPCGQIPEPRPVKIPKWVTELTSERK